jgi:hypothetical protein
MPFVSHSKRRHPVGVVVVLVTIPTVVVLVVYIIGKGVVVMLV